MRVRSTTVLEVSDGVRNECEDARSEGVNSESVNVRV